MVKKKIYKINSPEKFVDEWLKKVAEVIGKAEQMDIRLRNADDSVIDPYMLYITGEVSAEKLDKAGVDTKTKTRMLVMVSEIKKKKEKFREITDPLVTDQQIEDFFELSHKSLQIQQQLESPAVWVVIASLSWNGYSHDGRGILYLDEVPPLRARYITLNKGSK
jgi:hypothetical protein